LLGTDDIPREIFPDYSIPFEQVFHHYAMYLIKNTRDISFFSSTRRELTGVPSWVPDWRFISSKPNSSSLTCINSSHIEILGDGSCLAVDGIILGQVVTVCHPTQVEADLNGTLFSSVDTEENQDDISMRLARGLLAVIRGMQKLKDVCFQDLTDVMPGISLGDIQYHWERFWPGYLSEQYRPIREMIEGERKVDLTELMRGNLPVIVIGIGNELLKMSAMGLGILDNSGMVTTKRTDETIRNGDIICLLNSISEPCILRQNGLHYSFVAVCGMTSFLMDSAEERAFERYEVRRFILV
jgi:hypothetical protein